MYSSVGFGGGSSYLAILALFSVSYNIMPKIALICNIIVVSGSFFVYYKSKLISFSRVLPFVVASIPFSFWGGSTNVSKKLFLTLLGFSLLIASLRMFLLKTEDEKPSLVERSAMKNWLFGLSTGSFLGFLSGLIGIGGGIFLAPILYLTKWGKSKQIAATTSFFILVNSLAGLTGQFSKQGFTENFSMSSDYVLPLGIAVLIGGQIGSRTGTHIFSQQRVQQLTALLIFIVSNKILWEQLIN